MITRLPYVGFALVMLLAGMLVDRLAVGQPAPPAPPETTTSTTTTTTTLGKPRFTSVGAWSLPVRTAAEVNVTASTKRYGLEVYQDNVSGNTIYISETGSVAVAPAR
jgi:hypothetical protein